MFTTRLLACSAVAFALVSVAVPVQAQTKKELVQKLLQLQQPGIEALARNIAEQPAAQLMNEAGQLLKTQVPEAKRQAAAKAIEADIKKYLDEATPLVRDRAVKLAPSTLGAVMEEKFSEDELKQIIAWLESPVSKKYQQSLPDLQKSLAQKLVDDTRPSVEPKIRQLQANIRKQLGIAEPAAGSASAPGTAAKPKK
ncbi:DUF2059 domain-containing protein [Caldimonas brevitalea]|uniref:DUF2059 domain-containing protein n=1 Tax=Caldimonas brevitalea TaxID=413882 RepID=A0A0G3BQZ4_9BURK|nr:DUF2059 domain-containing protein [Caldimonas brevitalea]AKJ30418.1 hypothetical protein AAW51_3727 [Caldimonas brevitalea]